MFLSLWLFQLVKDSYPFDVTEKQISTSKTMCFIFASFKNVFFYVLTKMKLILCF